MSHSTTQSPSTSILSRLSTSIPELRLSVLDHLVQSPRLVIKDISTASPSSHSHLLLEFSCENDRLAHTFPANLASEYWSLRSQSWLTSPKYFSSGWDFCMSHYMLSLDPHSSFPALENVPDGLSTGYPLASASGSDSQAKGGESMNGTAFKSHPLLLHHLPNLSHHGLEKVVLALNAETYFSLFSIPLPPFTLAHTHADPHILGGASLLQHCTHLTIVFGSAFRAAHPWSSLDAVWPEAARLRPRTCLLGQVVDWILTYAWKGGYVQHIERVVLEGEIQEWVRGKWEGVFARWNEAKTSSRGDVDWRDVYEPDTERIEGRGRVEGGEWDPCAEFPPRCVCDRGCWRLGEGEVEGFGDVCWENGEWEGVGS